MIFLRLKGKISKFVLSFLLNKKRLKRRKMIFVGNAKRRKGKPSGILRKS